MRIERIVTRQGHPVPKAAYSPKGPFPPEIFLEPEIITDYEPQTYGGAPIPDGGTAQNNFQAVKKFTCNVCSLILEEQYLDSHICPEY